MRDADFSQSILVGIPYLSETCYDPLSVGEYSLPLHVSFDSLAFALLLLPFSQHYENRCTSIEIQKGMLSVSKI